MAEAHVRGRYMAVERLGVEPAIYRVARLRLYLYITLHTW